MRRPPKTAARVTGTARTSATLRRRDHSERFQNAGCSPGAYTGESPSLAAFFSARLEARLLVMSSVTAAAAARAAASRSAVPTLPLTWEAAFSPALVARFSARFSARLILPASAAFVGSAFGEAASVRLLENIWPPGG